MAGERILIVDDEESDATLLSDTWSLTWVEGTYRVWLPYADGLARYTSGGDGNWLASEYGTELSGADTDGVITEVGDPAYYVSSTLGPRMLFRNGADIRGATPADYLADWAFDEDPLLEGEPGAWDEWLDGPWAVQQDGITYLFYDGEGSGSRGIGLATSSSGYSEFERESDAPILDPGGDHDAVAQADPYVLWDDEADLWRMYYSAWDGAQWSVGLAMSDDLITWEPESEPVLSSGTGDLADPVVFRANGRFRMWAASRAAFGSWQVVELESVDGLQWSEPQVILEYPDRTGPWSGDEPPGLAMYVDRTESFRVEGEEMGVLGVHIEPGETTEFASYDWRVRVVVGQQLDLDDAGAAAENGVAVSSLLTDEGLAYLDLTDAALQPSIGVATWDGVDLLAQEDPVLEAGPEGSFDADGVSAPVVVRRADGSYAMYYAGHGDGLLQVGLATSSDGLTWVRSEAPVLATGESWDSIQVVPGSAEWLDGDVLRLWYAGSDGERFRIGAATSSDGTTFTRVTSEDGWLFGSGTPGDWDDTGVAQPFVITEDDTVYMWYSGFDGSTWRIGQASADAATLTWTRDIDEDGEARYTVQPTSGLFDYGGVARPVLWADGDGWGMFYRGWDGDVYRPGLARGVSRDVFYKRSRMPSAGDWLGFSTVAGEEGVNPIDLDSRVDGLTISGIGLTALHLDEERGFLYVASKLQRYITVIDVRDDSSSGFEDTNYLDVEAILTFPVERGSEWFRSLLTVEGQPWLYALGSSPESVMLFDLDALEDDGLDDTVTETLVGYLAAPRGGERDLGVNTVAVTGPAGMAMLPDGDTLLVTNYNDNSLSVYDLRMGAYGQLIGEVPFICENPAAVRVVPDGRYAVVACYEGEVDDEQVNSELAIVDIDLESDSWLEVLTWIRNR